MPWFRLNVAHETRLDPLEAWEFLNDVANLERMTPPKMKFKFLGDSDKPLSLGSILVYSIRPLPFFKTLWVSEISAFEPPQRFCDTQLKGPYSSWIHEHRIVKNTENKGCTIVDEIYFELPFGILGTLLFHLYVKKELLKAFTYRKRQLDVLIQNETHLNYQLTLKPLNA